ncbi:MAG: UDP-N-acetylmuramate--L-alanine ligase [Chitinophagaceae bacterium]|nr:UDP-N-acetylmuramate--L-alanine ligase [Chitinophagaceae bacterium]
MDLDKILRVYFIGIGGIGMSALAKYFHANGVTVSGYDKTSTPLTTELESEGMNIHFYDNIELLDKNAQLVVYTPAIPKDHKEFNYYLQNDYPLFKRSDILSSITKSTFNICVAGTHGKTTISAMIAHILRDSGYGCNAFLGGTSVNYNTNFWSNEKKVCVVEADEYDRSFLKLCPDVAVISAMDADHLDIYGTEELMQQAFVEFASKIKPGGLLISKLGLQKDSALTASNRLRYSLQNNRADSYASNITISNGTYHFDVVTTGGTLGEVVLNMGGLHNIENAVAAISVAHYLGIKDDGIKKAVQNFKGVKRRFEYIIAPAVVPNEAGTKRSGAKPGVVFIDDYAHHPQELEALIKGAKNLFPDFKCMVIFQPHLFTRTRDLAQQFAASLDLADEVILLQIYPARELPIEGITSNSILDKMKMKNENKSVKTSKELIEYLETSKNFPVEGTVLITAGAGDIDQLVEPIKKIIESK